MSTEAAEPEQRRRHISTAALLLAPATLGLACYFGARFAATLPERARTKLGALRGEARLTVGTPQWAQALRFGRGGQVLVALSGGGPGATVNARDASDGRQRWGWRFPRSETLLFTLPASADGRSVAALSILTAPPPGQDVRSLIRVWDIATGRARLLPIPMVVGQSPKYLPPSLARLAGPERKATSLLLYVTGAAWFWKPGEMLLHCHIADANSNALWNGLVILNLKTGTPRRWWPLPRRAKSLSFWDLVATDAAAGTALLGDGKRTRLYDIERGRMKWQVEGTPSGATSDLKLVRLRIADANVVWNVAQRKALWKRQARHGVRATFSPDGRLLALASNDGHVTILDARSGQEQRTVRVTEEVLGPDNRYPQAPAVCFSPDGRQMAAAGTLYGKPRLQFWRTD